MFVHVVLGAKIGANAVKQFGFYHVGLSTGSFVYQLLHGGVLPTRHVVGHLSRQHFAQPVGDWVVIRAGHNIRWRTLHHGHMRGSARHRRNNGDGGCTRTDDHHTLVGVVEVLWPLLRMNDGSGKPFAAGKHRLVALFVAVVTRAHKQEVARRHGLRTCLFVRCCDGPFGIRARPLCFRY